MVLIRAFAPTDQTAMIALYRAAWHAAYDAIDGANRIDALIASQLAGEAPSMFDLPPGDVALVGVSQNPLGPDDATLNGIVGGIRAHPRPDGVHISGFYVLPGAQRLGVGNTLLAHAFRLFPARPFRADVRPTSRAALALYHAHGFVETGRSRVDAGGGHSVDCIELYRAPPA